MGLCSIYANLTDFYQQRFDNNNAIYFVTSETKNKKVHINISAGGTQLADGDYIYPSLVSKPIGTSYLCGICRFADSTSDDVVITLKTNGDMLIACHNVGSKTITGFIASGYYTID